MWNSTLHGWPLWLFDGWHFRGPRCSTTGSSEKDGAAQQNFKKKQRGDLRLDSVKTCLITPPKFINSDFAPESHGGWKIAFLLGFGNFSGASC